MERISFLIEASGENISCLLNPESLVQRRKAGVRTLSGATGQITGAGLSDDPVIATGGGVTEYDLDLLFDIDIAKDERTGFGAPEKAGLQSDIGDDEVLVRASASTSSEDVRSLTRKIWSLTENVPTTSDRRGAPPTVRMIWGRAWNVLGVVVSVAERLERFTDKGVPKRSWMRIRMRRISEAVPRPAAEPPVTPQYEPPVPDAISGGSLFFLEAHVDENGLPVTRLDQMADDVYGDPGAWRIIATANDIENPLAIEEGSVLAMPDLGGDL
jgi:hypothetical protein